MNIKQNTLSLGPNQTVHYQYDQEADFLEIFFQREEEASAAIELTDNIILRFDWDTSTPLSLGFISFSKLLESADYEEKHFALLVDEWPDEVSGKVWHMLRKSPLVEVLKLGSYIPPNANTVMPMTAMNFMFAPDILRAVSRVPVAMSIA
ncbi:MAG: DUF2283 domain-containing protein [Chloroflexota bacterium]